jgi:hypothetical protein
MKRLLRPEASGFGYSLTQSLIPADRNLQLHRCENLKTALNFSIFEITYLVSNTRNCEKKDWQFKEKAPKHASEDLILNAKLCKIIHI